MSSHLPSRHKKGRPHSAKPYERSQKTNKASKKTPGLVEKVVQYLPSWLGLGWIAKNNSHAPEETEEDDDGSVVEDIDKALNLPGPSGIASSVQSGDSALVVSEDFTRNPLQRSAPQVNGDDQSEDSETSASTSGCSSLAPSHQERKKQVFRGLPISQSALEGIKSSLESKRRSILEERRTDKPPATPPRTEQENEEDDDDDGDRESKPDTTSTHTSLWSEDDYLNNSTRCMPGQPGKKRFGFSRPQQAGSSKKPCFSLSSYGTPGTFQASASPFYDGNTTFGGASAYRIARVAHQSPYQAPKSLNSFQQKRECMSSAAKRILNTLEKMSTPLSDARRIPAAQQSTEFALSFSPARYRQSLSRTGGPPMVDRATPHPCPVGRNLQTLRHFDMRQPETSTNSISSDQERTFCKAGGKMRTASSQSLHYSKPKVDEYVEDQDLPSVPLPISSLPSFSFKLPSATSTVSPALPTFTPTSSLFDPVLSSPSIPTSSPVISSSHLEQPTPSQQTALLSIKSNSPVGFTFATPRQTGEPASSANKLFESSSSPSFKFSDPTVVSAEIMVDSTVPPMFSSTVMSPSLQSAKIEPEKTKPTIVSPTSATDLIQGGSVLDFLKIPRQKEVEKKTDNLLGVKETVVKPGFGSLFKPPAGSWECQVCLVRNSSDDSKCVACETLQPAQSKSSDSNTKTANENVPIFPTSWSGTSFKKPPGSWECPICMINNNADITKCLACETSKPGSTTSGAISTVPISETSNPTQAPTGFAGTLYKPPVAGSWECDTCMVRNPASSLTKCQACETPRFSSMPTEDLKSTFKGFQFAKTNQTSQQPFNSGLSGETITTTGATSTTSSFVFGSPVVTSASTASFKFGLPTHFGSDHSSTERNSTTTTAVVGSGFKFGTVASADVSSAKSSGFVFGASKSDSVDKDKIDLDLLLPVGTSADVIVVSSVISSSTVPKVTADDSKKCDTAITTSVLSLQSMPEPKFSFGSLSSKSTGSAGFKFGVPSMTSVAEQTIKPALLGTNTEKTDFFPVSAPKTEVGQSSATKELALSDTFKETSTMPTPGGFKFSFSNHPTKGTESNTFSFKPMTTGGATTELGTITTAIGVSVSTTAATSSSTGGFAFPLKKDQGFSFSASQSEPVASVPVIPVTKTSNVLVTPLPPFLVTEKNSKESESESIPNKKPVFGGTTSELASSGGTPFSFTSTTSSSTTNIGTTTPTFSFGTSTTTAPSSTMPFVFGGATTKPITTSTIGTFSFGATQGQANLSQSTPVFGSMTPAQPLSGAAAPTFSFGSSSAPKSQANSNAPTGTGSSAPIFRFGGGNINPLPVSSGGTPIGGQLPAPAFGGFSSSTPSQSVGNMFASSTSQAATPVFQFGGGGASSAVSSTPFRFGNTQENAPGMEGSTAQQPAAPFGGFSNTPAFSGSSAAPPAFGAINPNQPQFPMLGPGTDNPFNATGSASGAAQGRKIRRAVRRVNKPPK